MAHGFDTTRFTTHRPTAGLRLSVIADMFAVARQRRALRRLDAERLNDLGLSQADVARETNRPLWDVPSHWRG